MNHAKRRREAERLQADLANARGELSKAEQRRREQMHSENPQDWGPVVEYWRTEVGDRLTRYHNFVQKHGG